MSDIERQLIALLAIARIECARKRAAEQKSPAIYPTMRPDPQAAAAPHGTLMSRHASA